MGLNEVLVEAIERDGFVKHDFDLQDGSFPNAVRAGVRNFVDNGEGRYCVVITSANPISFKGGFRDA